MGNNRDLYYRKKTKRLISLILMFLSIIVTIVLSIYSIKVSMIELFFFGLLFMIISFVIFFKSNAEFVELENEIMREIWEKSKTAKDARKEMLSIGLRSNFVDFFISQRHDKKETSYYNNTSYNNAAIEKYNNACFKCGEILRNANKPSRCNKVFIIDNDNFFKGLELYQYVVEWDIWRNNDKLYFYLQEMEGYPTYDYEKEAPYAFSVSIDDIQYFREEGDVTNELKISGGIVTQNKRTGKISQTPIKTQTVKNDTRTTIMVLNNDSVISKIKFSRDAYDVLFALIPEKEYNKVKNS